VSRVEGHGKVTILLDEDNKVHQVRLHIVEFRGFERFIQGRPYWEVPVMVQRLCGICPVSAPPRGRKALDLMVGASKVTPTAEKMRRLMHYGQILQSHALHFFHLSSPDLLFGFDSEVGRAQHRRRGGAAHPDIAKKGILLRKFGQEVIRITAGKRVHGTGAVPGGVNKSLTAAERDELLKDAYQMIAWSRDAVRIIKELHEQNPALYDDFGTVPLQLHGPGARPTAASTSTTACLRAKDADGQILFDQVDYADYDRLITEEVKPWSYMKFPYFTALGPSTAGTRSARWRACRTATASPRRSPSTSAASFVAYGGGSPARHAGLPLGAHDRDAARRRDHQGPAARRRPLRHRADGRRRAPARRRRRHRGAARHPDPPLPRGRRRPGDHGQPDRLHHHNNQAMNEAVREVARSYLDGRSSPRACSTTSRSPSAPSTPACPAPPTRWARCRLELVDCDGTMIGRLVRE
jgi:NAD-reducing hydrogenase large subunit